MDIRTAVGTAAAVSLLLGGALGAVAAASMVEPVEVHPRGDIDPKVIARTVEVTPPSCMDALARADQIHGLLLKALDTGGQSYYSKLDAAVDPYNRAAAECLEGQK